MITGETTDISEYIDFGFYDWVTYCSCAGLGELSLGKWLGVPHKIGQLMSYWILTQSGKVISCTTLQRATNAEQQSDLWKDKMHQYRNNINERIESVEKILLDTSEIPQWNRFATDEYMVVILSKNTMSRSVMSQ